VGEMQRELKSTSAQCQNANWHQCHTVKDMKAALIRAQVYSTNPDELTLKHTPARTNTTTDAGKHTRTNTQK